MEDNIQSQLKALEAKVDAVFVSVEKTRKYFQIILWVTVIMVVLPAIGLIFAIPTFIDVYTQALNF